MKLHQKKENQKNQVLKQSKKHIFEPGDEVKVLSFDQKGTAYFESNRRFMAGSDRYFKNEGSRKVILNLLKHLKWWKQDILHL